MACIKHKIPSSRENWKNDRLKGIGGSDAAIALGISPWKSQYTLWCEKTGRINNDTDNEAMRLGRDLEDYVAKRFSEETGKNVRKSSFSFQSKEHPFMLANVDRLIVGEDAGLECKTTSALTKTKYDKGDIPIQYYVQCMHYMAVTGKKKWYIAILVLGVGFYWYEVNWNDEEIANLIAGEKEFWSYVECDEEPPLDGSDSTAETIKQLYPESDHSHVSLYDKDTTLDRYIELKSYIKQMENEKRLIENTIKTEMENAEYAETDKYNIKWKSFVTNRVDTKLLQKEYPDIYASVLKESKVRKFEVKEATE